VSSGGSTGIHADAPEAGLVFFLRKRARRERTSAIGFRGPEPDRHTSGLPLGTLAYRANCWHLPHPSGLNAISSACVSGAIDPASLSASAKRLEQSILGLSPASGAS
jgi:hypothetical protein